MPSMTVIQAAASASSARMEPPTTMGIDDGSGARCRPLGSRSAWPPMLSSLHFRDAQCAILTQHH
jgi:hypothetical protein